jgi:hypothetical protein
MAVALRCSTSYAHFVHTRTDFPPLSSLFFVREHVEQINLPQARQ